MCLDRYYITQCVVVSLPSFCVGVFKYVALGIQGCEKMGTTLQQKLGPNMPKPKHKKGCAILCWCVLNYNDK